MGLRDGIYMLEIASAKWAKFYMNQEWRRSVAQYLVNPLHDSIGQARQDGSYFDTLQHLVRSAGPSDSRTNIIVLQFPGQC